MSWHNALQTPVIAVLEESTRTKILVRQNPALIYEGDPCASPLARSAAELRAVLEKEAPDLSVRRHSLSIYSVPGTNLPAVFLHESRCIAETPNRI